MIIVSACLLGIKCRYDGQRREIPAGIEELFEKGECLIPVCPEQLGGLPTPRSKNHLSWGDGAPAVINEEGADVTAEFLKGAGETLRIAKLYKAKRAILKSGSPSCGEEGVTTRLLRENGIEVDVIDALHCSRGNT